MSKRFQCKECNRFTQKFIATIESSSEKFNDIIEYCHFCDLGFYQIHHNHFEMVEIVQPEKVQVSVGFCLQHENDFSI
ncbi:MAG: hypothetical protein ACREAE_03655 [Nitrosopumilaceae archaeon]